MFHLNILQILASYGNCFNLGTLSLNCTIGGQAMSLLIGGVVSVIIGLLGLIFWWSDFVIILKGGIPIIIVLGGILAVYIGLDEIQDKLREERQKQEESLAKAREEIEMVRAQAEKYKEELDRMKEESKKKD